MLHSWLCIIWRLPSLLSNNKHVELYTKHRILWSIVFLNCCGMNFDRHTGGYLWERNSSITGWKEKMSTSRETTGSSGFPVYRIRKGIITMSSCRDECNARLQSVAFLQGSCSLHLVLHTLFILITPSKISPSTDFTKCDIHKKWKQIEYC